jgi:hypothetical protein
MSFTRDGLVDLARGYQGSVDMLSMGHWIDFEIHVYGRAVAEVGVFGSNGWCAKHRLGDDIELSATIENRLKGISVDMRRKTGRLHPKGTMNIRGEGWKRPRLAGECP